MALGSENHQLTTALNAAEVRLNELYAEQSRSEIELAQRIDISEKLRDQVRELEKERRDIQRRYNEQVRGYSRCYFAPDVYSRQRHSTLSVKHFTTMNSTLNHGFNPCRKPGNSQPLLLPIPILNPTQKLTTKRNPLQLAGPRRLSRI